MNERDLLALGTLGAQRIRVLLASARFVMPTARGPTRPDQSLAGRVVALLFFEDSTRTRIGFTMAARRLGADVIDLHAGRSSLNKGESFADTARTIEAMGADALVVRTRQAGGAALIARAVACPVINAGDGAHEHPTQGLTDAYALAEAADRLDGFDLSGLRVAIVGDVANSRVARSDIAALGALGAEVTCVGPPALAPASLETLGCRVGRDLDAVLPSMDAAIMLRVQFERHGGDDPGGQLPGQSPLIGSVREYRAAYALSAERARLMKPSAVLMHPGPVNRGLEIDPAVANGLDGGPASLILRQVAIGVGVRMSVLQELVAPR